METAQDATPLPGFIAADGLTPEALAELFPGMVAARKERKLLTIPEGRPGGGWMSS
jgi:hypothetical protein